MILSKMPDSSPESIRWPSASIVSLAAIPALYLPARSGTRASRARPDRIAYHAPCTRHRQTPLPRIGQTCRVPDQPTRAETRPTTRGPRGSSAHPRGRRSSCPRLLTLGTVRDAIEHRMDGNPTPYGYTVSLLIFVLPNTALLAWFLRTHPRGSFRRVAFWWTIGLLWSRWVSPWTSSSGTCSSSFRTPTPP